jgi:hypothetical protein
MLIIDTVGFARSLWGIFSVDNELFDRQLGDLTESSCYTRERRVILGRKLVEPNSLANQRDRQLEATLPAADALGNYEVYWWSCWIRPIIAAKV